MTDIIIVAAAVLLSLGYSVYKIIRFISNTRRGQICCCSGSDCANCPAAIKKWRC